MRWIAKDSERKPDPEPIKGTARKAVIAGMIAFAISLVVVIVCYDSIQSPNKVWFPYTAAVGLLLGVFALFRVKDR
ncbi:MAG: hypothetical protein EBT82_01965 [Micrococcales bacterium]|nr:hypothetical protein [Micrococcales bacterium]NBR54734.1 hypothetical protein [Micrococcales bacterium]NBT46464.1 hypothetical protein [Actinomycetota bacterium]NBY44062.1 hypothetical protein [Micrococcales bacterium]NDE88359.1 hypothetical protein [Micrococcales bacterium]